MCLAGIQNLNRHISEKKKNDIIQLTLIHCFHRICCMTSVERFDRVLFNYVKSVVHIYVECHISDKINCAYKSQCINIKKKQLKKNVVSKFG